MRMWTLMGNWFFNLISMFRFLFTSRYSSHLCRFSQNQHLIVTELGSVKSLLLQQKKITQRISKNLLFFYAFKRWLFRLYFQTRKSLEFIATSCKVSIPVIEMMVANFWNNLSFLRWNKLVECVQSLKQAIPLKFPYQSPTDPDINVHSTWTPPV